MNWRLSHHAWVQVVKGEVDLNGTTLKASDGAAISDETLLKIRASKTPRFCCSTSNRPLGNSSEPT
jgi:redox-sensitive bicupin YhaK (pirin superfamily)